MYTKSIVVEIQKLRQQNISQRQIAKELGISRKTVRHYWDSDPLKPPVQHRKRDSLLAPHQEEIYGWYRQHRNADVVRQEFQTKYQQKVSLRTIQYFLKPLRQEIKAEEASMLKAMNRIETPPGQYMQIDFGEMFTWIDHQKTKIHLFVAVLAYSRRRFVWATLGEQQADWLEGIEKAFAHFGGIPSYIVCDNPRSMVKDPAKRGTRSCCFNDRFVAFCRYWDVQPIACYPYYPQSKGKVERSVGYVKHNAIAGHHFESFDHLQKHLQQWMVNVADQLIMKELPEDEEKIPIQRFVLEQPCLRLVNKPAFVSLREIVRKVGAKGLLRIGNANYRMPANYSGTKVRVQIDGDGINVFSGAVCIKQFHRTLDRVKPNIFEQEAEDQFPRFGATDRILNSNPLQRNLSEYEIIIGGKW